MARLSRAVSSRESAPLVDRITELAKVDQLLPGTHLVLERIEARGSGRQQTVAVDFWVPQEIKCEPNLKRGGLAISGDGARFSYTFVTKDRWKDSLRAFQVFYEKRSGALVNLPAARPSSRKAQINLADSSAETPIPVTLSATRSH